MFQFCDRLTVFLLYQIEIPYSRPLEKKKMAAAKENEIKVIEQDTSVLVCVFFMKQF